MLSALNAYGGLSAAELLTLFGVKSSSSSSAKSETTAQLASSANNPTNAIQAILAQAQSGANNPANAIQAILAQARIAQAQAATSGDGSASVATVAAAYAAQTGSSGSPLSAGATIFSSDAQIAVQAQTEPSGEGSPTSVLLEAAYAAQVAVASSVITPPAWQQESVSQVDNSWLETNAASLLVVTGSDAVNITMGTADQQHMAFRTSSALGSYQYNLATVQQEEAESQIPAWETSAPSASASNETNDPSSGYLQLTIWADGEVFEDEDAFIQAQAQQLIAAFENNTLTSAPGNTTGFSYAGTYGFSDFAITGIEVPDSNVLGYGMTPVTQESAAYNPGFAGLVNESTALSGGYNASFEDLAFAIPLGNS
jgi:hypothetical protein